MAEGNNPVEITLSAGEIAAVRAPLERAALLPTRVYSDPKIFEIEKERIFARSWLQVCHVSQIPKPGDFVVRNLLGEAVLAVRGRDDEIRILSNVCRHRNTTLKRGSGSCKGNRIICPYHGWTYGLDGRLLAAPFMDEAEEFNRNEIKLPEFRHEVWHGFVFVNFDENAESLATTLADLEPAIAPFNLVEMEAFEIRRYTVNWNWKVSLENFSEAYHQPWVHPTSAEHAFPAKLADYLDTTGTCSLFYLNEANGEKVPTFAPPPQGASDEFLTRVSVFNVYPYFHSLCDPASPLMLDFNIKDENTHELIWTVFLPKGSRRNPDIENQIEEIRKFLLPIWAEDTDVCLGVSQGVQSRFTQQGRLSHMEKALHQFHNWWLDKMLA